MKTLFYLSTVFFTITTLTLSFSISSEASASEFVIKKDYFTYIAFSNHRLDTNHHFPKRTYAKKKYKPAPPRPKKLKFKVRRKRRLNWN